MYNYTTMVLLGGCAMESQFEWRDEFNIGVESIDREHQRLFKIINKLFAFREEEKDSQWTCQEGIKYFKSHAVNHFNDEEAYMESIGYEGLEHRVAARPHHDGGSGHYRGARKHMAAPPARGRAGRREKSDRPADI